jgi:ergothioneine biosynthesis protein EgtB
MDASSPGYSAAEAVRSGGREPVRRALLAARQRTLALAQALLPADSMRVPHRPTLNPPLWELGHIAWFQEWWIGRNRQRAQGVACDPDHSRDGPLMAGADGLYDSSRVPHSSRWDLPLPDLAATRGYLAATLAQTLTLLDKLPEDAAHADLYFFRLVALHEEMHAEAGCYMARALGIALPAQAPWAATAAPAGVLQIPAQTFLLGASGPGFAFDNELNAHETRLAAYEIDAQPLSWSRFMPFVEAGGYRKRECWSEEGWAWLRASAAPRPRAADVNQHEAALHLTAYEAEAWCRWAGRRLPTEAEWECAALGAPGFSWGQAWEWTASAFQPYPGFTPHPYRDYSLPWFGSRRVLRGACVATAPTLAHPRYRNFFEPHRNDVFAGFRSCA